MTLYVLNLLCKGTIFKNYFLHERELHIPPSVWLGIIFVCTSTLCTSTLCTLTIVFLGCEILENGWEWKLVISREFFKYTVWCGNLKRNLQTVRHNINCVLYIWYTVQAS